jgi:nicotinate phosphoribosyltransferase
VCSRARRPGLADSRLTPDERAWLAAKCPYFPSPYLDFLASFRFNPHEHIRIEHDEEIGELSIVITGRWVDTILYEVPLLALLSEAYFLVDDKRWDMRGQRGVQSHVAPSSEQLDRRT